MASAEGEQVSFIVGKPEMIDVIVIGAGPAGVVAAIRAADLGAHTVLVTHAEFGQ
jgi:pyruvate/2-oxoglutarate dehydrogenase complex dihydrolipoamide dehydrogenase (E3) component